MNVVDFFQHVVDTWKCVHLGGHIGAVRDRCECCEVLLLLQVLCRAQGWWWGAVRVVIDVVLKGTDSLS